ncbi:MAG TPA: heme lyase CcmF/NrfE family subunit [Bryobacteraceae bacterium]|jgi:cytochrome c-type biogenesis protein CcmF|nr:heme lyase CcmF/NrfE family subunit [Bryobacteraceae bacterium]
MENIGALSVLLAFCFAVYSILASVIGKLTKRPFLILSAERAVYSIWVLVTIAAGILIYSLMTGDYRMAYVAHYTNRAMPSIYKYTAWWGGQEGSLLFWNWLLASYGAVVVYRNQRKFREMMPWVVAVMMSTQVFFLTLIVFIESPFKVLTVGRRIVDVGDGQGLSALLQYWTMIIHPPMLYLGYVGFVVPFAFAVASLITKAPGEAWIHVTRRWTLVTWMFQTTGVLLGAGWAYSVLGWGGYWGWDPVENASLLPWITATAFLHSVMMQEKKGMMKVWNMVLVSATFFLCIFGTFLTRSGIVNSVHAFSQGPIGMYFVVFLSIGIAATVTLIVSRLDFLKSEASMESVLSRESSFLFNNLVLLASCFAILWGTLFPVISEKFTGEKISVDAPFFNRINIPIAMFLLLLTGVGPLIAWRKSSFDSLKRAFLWPTVAGVAVAAGLFGAGVRSFYALVSFALCSFVLVTVVMEFVKGANAIASKDKSSFISSMIELTHRNTRRYGGYLVHVGVVIMFIGFTGKAFDLQKTVEIEKGDVVSLGKYTLRLVDIQEGQNDNYRQQNLVVDVTKNGEHVGTLKPEKRLYLAKKEPASNVAIRRRLNEDLYINFAGLSDDGTKAVMQAYVFPLVSWIWIGYWVVLSGTIICLIPSKSRLIYPRMEIVGVAGKHAKV